MPLEALQSDVVSSLCHKAAENKKVYERSSAFNPSDSGDLELCFSLPTDHFFEVSFRVVEDEMKPNVLILVCLHSVGPSRPGAGYLKPSADHVDMVESELT